MARSLLAPAAIAIMLSLLPGARAADVITPKPASPNARAEHFILTPGNLRFGTVAVGQQKVLSNSNITLLQAMITGNSPTLSRLDLPLTLAWGDRFAFSGVFALPSGDNASGSISLVSEVSSTAKPIPASRMGAGSSQLTVDPARIDFGTVAVGSNADQRGTLIASDSEVTISSANIGNPEFTLSGLSFPFTIPAGGRQDYTVTFTPQAPGAVLATLSFLTAAGSSLAIQTLTGIGGGRSAHWVDLSWNASGSLDVIGYNVYRGQTLGGPYLKINSVLDTSTVYTDALVSEGDAYYYVTTSVDSSGQESAYSNEVEAIVP
jgi:hypothetical protein